MTDIRTSAVKSHGGEAVMTSADHPSGSDRIFEAPGKLDPRSRNRDCHQPAGGFSDYFAR
jgi:CMP-2-keto-3-deoxyoctulosonic acid synthetase